MGRNKIKIESIKNERNRMVTFIKRKKGLFKKAMELAVLCDAKVFVAVYSKEQQLSIVSTSDKAEVFIEQYLTTPLQTSEFLSIKDYVPLFGSDSSKEPEAIDSFPQKEHNENIHNELIAKDDNSHIAKNTVLYNNNDIQHKEITNVNNSIYQKSLNANNNIKDNKNNKANNENINLIQSQLNQISQHQTQTPFYNVNPHDNNNNILSLPFNSFLYPLQLNLFQNQNASILPFINLQQYYLSQQVNETPSFLIQKRQRDSFNYNNNSSINN